jgi:hypothetical protein
MLYKSSYKETFSIAPVTSFGRTRDQVVPEIGLVVDDHIIISLLGPTKTTQGFPSSFRAVKIVDWNYVDECTVDSENVIVYRFKNSKIVIFINAMSFPSVGEKLFYQGPLVYKKTNIYCLIKNIIIFFLRVHWLCS